MATAGDAQREMSPHTQCEKTDSRDKKKPHRWNLGIMADSETDEVPGSVLLLSGLADHNAPLGISKRPRSDSSASRHSERSEAMFGKHMVSAEKKRTSDGKIILEPQPDESLNDPLNWSALRRDAALISLGFYCMLGGGMTPILAAGFTNVAATYHVTVPQVALTTGLYMLGLGVGSVIWSPTAIAIGKRPVYLFASVFFVLTAVWCALSPNYASLVVARVFMGLAVSPVECLPSATIAEIFFLHERAYRLGIYTLLLLGGKNLIPLVSAAIIQGLSWEWVFWIVAIIVGFCSFLLFFFVPETFWDRTPTPHRKSAHRRPTLAHLRKFSSRGAGTDDEKQQSHGRSNSDAMQYTNNNAEEHNHTTTTASVSPRHHLKRARFSGDALSDSVSASEGARTPFGPTTRRPSVLDGVDEDKRVDSVSPTEMLNDPMSPSFFRNPTAAAHTPQIGHIQSGDEENGLDRIGSPVKAGKKYTMYYQSQPPKSYWHSLRPYSGLLSHDNWFRVAARPFILFAYPAILWSAVVYALSVGWLIVLSESVSTIYRSKTTYNFTALQTGLVYLSPFIGGVLGTAVAGKLSDVIVRFMARRNGGIYEPEFRLVMAIPVILSTTIGLMGYGWAAQERDAWIVPTVFFGIISFGCCVGSTTAITFAVDSYRQYAGEALVTLNFSKNIFHGLVFSLFFNRWLDDDGPRTVFLALGGIQLGFLLFTIPMYIYGKRARMWTVRKNMMGKF